MNPFEVKNALSSATLVVDDREKHTEAYYQRLADIGLPYEIQRIESADYSIKCDKIDLTDIVAIERKSGLRELASNYGIGRKNFTDEFERAKAINKKIYLLVEEASWDILFSDKAYSLYCPGKYHRNAFIASLITWMARYNTQLVFCDKSQSPFLIKAILMKELEHYLINMPDEEGKDV